MSYIAKRLANGETVLHEGRFHWMQKLTPWLALLFLGIIVVGVVIWAYELIRMATTEMYVTNRRVILKRGFFNVHLEELTLDSVEGAYVNQPIIGRLFGFGKLVLRGRGETQIVFPSMDRPTAFRAAVESARISEEARPVEVVPAEEPVVARPARRGALRAH